MTKKCDVIVDLQFGSTGKGLIAGYLAKKYQYDTVVNANMPNAGHTFIDHTGRKWVHKVLPNGVVSPNIKNVMIGPGSVFSIMRLYEEVAASTDILKDATIYIHENAIVLQDRHRNQELNSLSGISSTMQGSSAAMIEKILRDPKMDSSTKKWLSGTDNIGGVKIKVVGNSCWLDILYKSENILLEGAQGYSLGINSGFWPFCTSRDCTPARFMSDCMVPLRMLRRVIGTARTFPIRVGNTSDGYSGGCYYDQCELSWDELGLDPEFTTVTKRKRRIFSFSKSQIKEAIMAAQPNEVFLNFANYCPDSVEHIITTINEYIQDYTPGGGSVRYVGWGPGIQDVKERHLLNPCDYTTKEQEEGWVA